MNRINPPFVVLTIVLALCCGAVGQKFAYVANTNSDSVSVIDTASYTVVTTIPVGSIPHGVTITPDGRHAYVANYGSGTVSVIDTSSNTVTATVGVGAGPYGVAISLDGTHAYVSNGNSSTVSVINTSSNTVSATVAVGAQAAGIAITPDGTRVYVDNEFAGSVSVIDTSSNSVVATIAVGPYPVGIVISPDGTRAYTAVGQDQNTNGSVAVIDTASNTITATVQVGPAPTLLAITPDGTRVYVANNVFPQATGTVSVIDTANNVVTSTVPIGPGGAYAVAISPDGTRTWVTNIDANSVSVINVPTNTVITAIAVGAAPQAVAITPFLDSDTGLAKLVGGNAFTGNQTVNGNVAASAFVGDGFGILNLNPANLASGTAAINITGMAASALNASNALNLGGVAAGNYARLDIGNAFIGNQSVTGNLSASGNLATGGSVTIGSGTPIVEHLSYTLNLSNVVVAPATCTTFPSPILSTAGSDGDSLVLGVPDSLVNPTKTGAGILNYFAWISPTPGNPSINTITIRVCNLNPNGPKMKAGVSGAIRVDIWKH